MHITAQVHLKYAKLKKPYPKGYTLRAFWKSHDDCRRRSTSVVARVWEWKKNPDANGTREHDQLMESFHIFIVVAVTRLYTVLKTLQIAYLKCKFDRNASDYFFSLKEKDLIRQVFKF